MCVLSINFHAVNWSHPGSVLLWAGQLYPQAVHVSVTVDDASYHWTYKGVEVLDNLTTEGKVVASYKIPCNEQVINRLERAIDLGIEHPLLVCDLFRFAFGIPTHNWLCTSLPIYLLTGSMKQAGRPLSVVSLRRLCRLLDENNRGRNHG
jgi:hypothetical protein